MTKTNSTKQKITIRVTPRQAQVLKELTDSCNCSQSLLIRMMIGDFITRNEDVLERIITGEHIVDFSDNYNTEEDF